MKKVNTELLVRLCLPQFAVGLYNHAQQLSYLFLSAVKGVGNS